VPGTLDEFVASRSKKTRDNLKRYAKKLLRDHGDELSLRVFSKPEEIDELFAAVEEVAAKTYQRGLGVAIADGAEHRRLIGVGLERGWFRAYVLSLAGRPVAFWPGTAFRGTFSVGTPGYDPAFAEYRVGMYVLLRVIEDLCADEGIDVLDFGPGEAAYKRQLGNESWEEEDVLVFARTLRGIRVNASRTIVAGAVTGAQAAVEKAGVDGWLRRRLRQKLASEPTSPTG
jgi:CelD/BcsL family acetyltransferase involved in cellulose biosynthesis